MTWSNKDIADIRKAIAQSTTVAGGIKAAADRFDVSPSAIRDALRRRGTQQIPVAAPAGATEDEAIATIVRLSKKGITFEDLCDALTLPPKTVRGLLDTARDRGHNVAVLGNDVLRAPGQPAADVVCVAAPPARAGESRIFGVMTDLHFGSRYHLRSALVDFVDRAYESGVRTMFLPGDLLDGCYRHGRWELTHHGFYDQCEDFCAGLPQRKGLRYLGISGNHDQTFEETGLVVHTAIEDVFRRNGRTDLTMLGARGATVRLRGKGDPERGLLVEMWHPLKGPAYALSYKLQKKIEGYAPGQKPDVLLTGHWHQSVYVNQRGIHALSCGTFQGGGSAFGRALGGSPSIGGWTLQYALTPDGTVRELAPKWHGYFESEAPREVAV